MIAVMIMPIIPQDAEVALKEPVIEYIDEWYDSALCICLFCVDEQVGNINSMNLNTLHQHSVLL